jgi:LPXTG-site transpeptidase (sortase) family protein
MPEGSDRTSVIAGKDIHVNPYLRNGVLHYPNSALAGELGNMVIAGHSSYWYSDTAGLYKTAFGFLPTVDTGEEVWIYKRSLDTKSKKYTHTRYRYRVTASYNTNPYDVGVLIPEKGKKLLTLFTCTPIG